MSEVFQLAILLSARDLASGNLDRVADKLRATGKEGKATLKTFEDLRKDFRQGLQLAGIGVAGLAALRGGVRVAGDFEAAMADLRLSIQEVGKDGRVDVQKLGDEMNRFEQLGVKLGNSLPGTTQDFIEMFSTLKQGGLDTRTILDGTGEAVANLAVVTGQVPRDLAEPFAQYAQQFSLTGKEAVQLADVLAKLKFRTGLNPQELIEGSKFFQLRAGAPLGLTGLEGAEVSGRLLATLRKAGLEGGIGGRELSGMFSRLTLNTKEQQKAMAELNRQGINLQFFDKKGKFLGVENVFAQLEKLRKLSQESRIDIAKKLFGEEAVGPATVMIKAGLQGWRDTNAEIDKGAKLQDAINTKTATFNAKWESLIGTAQNLVATAFLPMLETLKPIVDNANKVVGSIQEWSKAHQTTSNIITHLVGISSVALVVVGAFKSMRAAWGLWKIASAVGGGESALLRFFRDTRVGADAAGDSMVGAATKAKGLRGRLAAMPSAVSTSITLIGIEYAISKTMELYGALKDYQEALDDLHTTGVKGLETHKRLETELAKRGKTVPEQITKTTAATAFASLNINDQLVRGLRNDLSIYMPFAAQRPYSFLTTGFDPKTAGKVFRERAPELEVASVMREFISQLKTKVPEVEQRDRVMKALEAGFPETFRTVQASLMELRSPADDLRTTFSELRGTAGDASLKLKQLAAAQFPTVGTLSTGGAPVPVPSRAMGGEVHSEGIVNVHPGERIIPARVTRGLSGGRSGDMHVTNHITINVPPNSPATQDSRLLARLIAEETRRQKERR